MINDQPAHHGIIFRLTHLRSDNTPTGLVYEPYQSTSGQDGRRHEERVGQGVSGVFIGYEHDCGSVAAPYKTKWMDGL